MASLRECPLSLSPFVQSACPHHQSHFHEAMSKAERRVSLSVFPPHIYFPWLWQTLPYCINQASPEKQNQQHACRSRRRCILNIGSHNHRGWQGQNLQRELAGWTLSPRSSSSPKASATGTGEPAWQVKSAAVSWRVLCCSESVACSVQAFS